MADTAALVVALSAQLSQFQKDMDAAVGVADSSIKKIEDGFSKANPDASKMLQNFSEAAKGPAEAAGASIGSALLVGFSATIAGVVARLGSIVDGLAKIGDRADDLRLPVNLLQALSVAADAARVSQSDLNKGLDNFTVVSKKTEEDAKEFYQALRNIDKGFVDSFKSASTQQERLRLVGQAYNSTTDEVKKAQLGIQAFNTDSQRTLSVLAQNSAQIDKTADQMKSLGLSIDEGAVKRAQEARSQLSLLARVLTDELSSALAGLIPVFSRLVPFMQQLSALSRDVVAIFQAEGLKGADTLAREAETLGQQLAIVQQKIEALGDDPQTTLEKIAAQAKAGLQGLLIEYAGYTKQQLTETKETLTQEADEIIKKIEDINNRIKEIRKSGEAPPTTGTGGAFAPRPALVPKETGKDPFEQQVDSINRHIAALNADAAAVGLTEAAHQGLRTELALLQSIERAGGEVTQDQIDKYSILRASMTQQQALTAAGINLNTEHAATFQSVSDRMVQAAGRADDLKRAYLGVQSAIQFGGNELINIMDALRTKTQSASEAMRSLTNNLLKALEQALLLGQGPLAGLLGTQSARAGGTGGILGALFSSFGTTGGGAGGIGHAQHGGPVSAGRPYVVGEHGPELFVPGASGHIVPNAISGGRGGGSMVEINNYVAADTETRQQRSEGPNGERVIIDIVKKAQARGDLDDVNRGRFGLRPAKVR